MSSAKRKLHRKKVKDAQKDLSEKVGLFDKIPNQCLSCETSFDKNDKEQVSSWRVVVREEQNRVNLYCPTCWDQAVGMLNDMEKRMKEKVDEGI